MRYDNQFTTSFSRRNFFSAYVLPLFLAFASYPRILLEVFLRKNFGRRYYSLSTALMLAGAMIIYPFIVATLYTTFPASFSSTDYGYITGYEGIMNQQVDYYAGYETWFIFFLVYIGFAILRRIELFKKPSGFNFNEHSMYCGNINKIFFKIKFKGKPVPVYIVEIFLEPLVFFTVGYILDHFEQKLGLVLQYCSIWYSLSYVAAYANGNRIAQDLSDKYVVNNGLAEVMDNISPSSETSEYSQDKPAKETLRPTSVADSNYNYNPKNDDDSAHAL